MICSLFISDLLKASLLARYKAFSYFLLSLIAFNGINNNINEKKHDFKTSLIDLFNRFDYHDYKKLINTC
jgi:hypothetical protein